MANRDADPAMSVRVVHLLSEPHSERERRSIASVEAVADLCDDRVLLVNPYWAGEMPTARECPERWFALTKGHYGCWKAHRDAITDHLTGVDALLVCECDCLFVVPPEEVRRRIDVALRACIEAHLTAFTFGFRHNGQTIDRVGEEVIVISQWIGTECYLVPIQSRPVFDALFAMPFDAYDLLLTSQLIDRQGCRVGTFADRPIAVQSNGVSLITGGTNTNEEHFRNVRY